MVKFQPSKLAMRVRFPLPAPPTLIGESGMMSPANDNNTAPIWVRGRVKKLQSGNDAGRPALSGNLCDSLVSHVCYCATPFTKFKPLGVPTPVTLSHPGPVVSDVSVPNVITNQRVEKGLL